MKGNCLFLLLLFCLGVSTVRSDDCVKRDGTLYQCTCIGNCDEMHCVIPSSQQEPDNSTEIPTVTLTDDDDDDNGDDTIIGGSVVVLVPPPTQSHIRHRPATVVAKPVPVPVPVPVPGVAGRYGSRLQGYIRNCNENGRVTPLGQSYDDYRSGYRRTCTCVSLNNVLQIYCQQDVCKKPPAPNQMRSGVYPNCHDPWNNAVYDNGATYERTRRMNVGDSITGTYSCQCLKGSIKCTAIDIPCCDLVTKKFVGRNERFNPLEGGRSVTCTCHRGRASFGNCTATPKSEPRQGEIRYAYPSPLLTHLQQQITSCYDKKTGKTYQNNQRFVQYRQSGLWNCKCIVLSHVSRIRCSMKPRATYVPYNLQPRYRSRNTDY